MKRQAYESPPLPISWERTDYIQGKREMAVIYKPSNEPKEVERALAWIKSDDLRTKRIPDTNIEMDNLRNNILYLPVDSAAVVQSGIVKPENYDKIVKEIIINLGERKDEEGNVIDQAKRVLSKQEMMVLEILNNNRDWSRPIYFAITVSPELYLRLEQYFRQDGIAYRLVPYDMEDEKTVDTDIMYENLMHKYRWGNLEEPGIYLDDNAMRMSKTFRLLFARLSKELIAEEKMEKAKEVLDYGLTVLPQYNVPYDYYSSFEIGKNYYLLGEIEKAREIYDVLASNSLKTLKWFSGLSPQKYTEMLSEIRREIGLLHNLLINYPQINPEAFEMAVDDFNRYAQQYEQFLKSRQTRQRGGANR
jgi:hypothetical protein